LPGINTLFVRLSIKEIDHFIGDPVTHLVGMALGN
jgi:hypothetical protein